MLSLRDIIDFAAMSEDLAHELKHTKVGLPDLGAVVAGTGSLAVGLHPCGATPCAANDGDTD
jgi:predicted RNA methylase